MDSRLVWESFISHGAHQNTFLRDHGGALCLDYLSWSLHEKKIECNTEPRLITTLINVADQLADCAPREMNCTTTAARELSRVTNFPEMKQTCHHWYLWISVITQLYTLDLKEHASPLQLNKHEPSQQCRFPWWKIDKSADLLLVKKPDAVPAKMDIPTPVPRLQKFRNKELGCVWEERGLKKQTLEIHMYGERERS